MLQELEDKIGYHFKDKKYLKTALTHSSYANENKKAAQATSVWNFWVTLFWVLLCRLSVQALSKYAGRCLNQNTRITGLQKKQLCGFATQIGVGNIYY